MKYPTLNISPKIQRTIENCVKQLFNTLNLRKKFLEITQKTLEKTLLMKTPKLSS